MQSGILPHFEIFSTVLTRNASNFDKLLKSLELEHQEYKHLLDKESQYIKALEEDLKQSQHKIVEFQKSTSLLDEDTKRVYNQFVYNRDACHSLKKTAIFLDEHINALGNELKMQLQKNSEEELEHKAIYNKYMYIWQSYKKKYENFPWTKILREKQQIFQETEAKIALSNQKLKELDHDLEMTKENNISFHEVVLKIAKLKVNSLYQEKVIQQKSENISQLKDCLQQLTKRHLQVQNSLISADQENMTELNNQIDVQNIESLQKNMESLLELDQTIQEDNRQESMELIEKPLEKVLSATDQSQNNQFSIMEGQTTANRNVEHCQEVDIAQEFDGNNQEILQPYESNQNKKEPEQVYNSSKNQSEERMEFEDHSSYDRQQILELQEQNETNKNNDLSFENNLINKKNQHSPQKIRSYMMEIPLLQTPKTRFKAASQPNEVSKIVYTPRLITIPYTPKLFQNEMPQIINNSKVNIQTMNPTHDETMEIPDDQEYEQNQSEIESSFNSELNNSQDRLSPQSDFNQERNGCKTPELGFGPPRNDSSPFDFDRHFKTLKDLNTCMSPTFTFTSKPMFKISKDTQPVKRTFHQNYAKSYQQGIEENKTLVPKSSSNLQTPSNITNTPGYTSTPANFLEHQLPNFVPQGITPIPHISGSTHSTPTFKENPVAKDNLLRYKENPPKTYNFDVANYSLTDSLPNNRGIAEKNTQSIDSNSVLQPSYRNNEYLTSTNASKLHNLEKSEFNFLGNFYSPATDKLNDSSKFTFLSPKTPNNNRFVANESNFNLMFDSGDKNQSFDFKGKQIESPPKESPFMLFGSDKNTSPKSPTESFSFSFNSQPFSDSNRFSLF